MSSIDVARMQKMTVIPEAIVVSTKLPVLPNTLIQARSDERTQNCFPDQLLSICSEQTTTTTKKSMSFQYVIYLKWFSLI